MSEKWTVYIVECADKTLYTGITKNLERRLTEHNDSRLGARYTRGRRPVIVVYSNYSMPDKSAALKEENRIKKLPRASKLLLIQGFN